MQMQTHSHGQGHKVVFMPSMHNEALELLHEAQDYFSSHGSLEQSGLEPQLQSVYACEMSRITLRLSCVMSWLLAARATIAGESVNNNNLIEFQDICSVDSSLLHGVLPSYVCYLLDASYELYERALRLEEQKQVVH